MRASHRLFGQELCEGLFSLSGRRCHVFKKHGRARYRRRFPGTVNLPSPGFRLALSQRHGDRIVGWVKFFVHAAWMEMIGLIFKLCRYLSPNLVAGDMSSMPRVTGSQGGRAAVPKYGGALGKFGELCPIYLRALCVRQFSFPE